MSEIKKHLEKQLELSNELTNLLSQIDSLETNSLELLYEENKKLLAQINEVNSNNLSSSFNRAANLKSQIENLLYDKNIQQDQELQKKLIEMNDCLNHLADKVEQVEADFLCINDQENTNTTALNSTTKNTLENKKTVRRVPPSKAKRTSSSMNKNIFSDFEFNIGSNILNIIGVILILISLITFGRFVYTNYLTNQLKGLSLFIISMLILVSGETFFKKKVPRFAIGISALGIGSLYASLIINYLILGTLTPIIAILLTIIITGLSIKISSINDSDIIRAIGLIGGYGCLFPLSKLNMMDSFITISMLLIISTFNIYTPIKSKHFSVYSSVVNILFCILVMFTGAFQEITVYIYLILTFILNNWMCIKPYNENNTETLIIGNNIFTLNSADEAYNNKEVLIISNLIFTLISAFNYINIAFFYLIFSIIAYFIAHDKFKTSFLIQAISNSTILMLLYYDELGILSPIIYGIILAATILLNRRHKDNYLNIILYILTSIGLILFYGSLKLSFVLLYLIIFSILIWVLALDNIDNFISVNVKRATLLILLNYIYILDSSRYDFILISALSILYVILVNNIHRLRHTEIKLDNAIILGIALFILSICINQNLIAWTCGAMLIAAVLILSVNTKYIDNEFITTHKFLIYSLYITYGIISLFGVTSISNLYSNVLMSICLMIAAFGNVFVGFKINNVSIRKYGLILSLITCTKLILVDFYMLDFIFKTVLFLIVGIGALAISYIYNKLDKQIK